MARTNSTPPTTIPLPDSARYRAYAKAQGRTPKAQYEHDQESHGSHYPPFADWLMAQLKAMEQRHPDCFSKGTLLSFQAFDRFIADTPAKL